MIKQMPPYSFYKNHIQILSFLVQKVHVLDQNINFIGAITLYLTQLLLEKKYLVLIFVLD